MTIRVAGELLSDAAAELTLLLADELPAHPARVLIDLSAVTLIDAPGANALLLATGMAEDSDIPLRLAGVRGGPVETVLSNLELLHRFDITDTGPAKPVNHRHHGLH